MVLERIREFFGIGMAAHRRGATRPSRRGRNRRLTHEQLEDRRMLATLTVNVTHDNVDGNGNPLFNDGDLTLRDAIAYVNQQFAPGPNDIESNGVVHIDLTEPLGTNDRILFNLPADEFTITLGIDDNGQNLMLGENGDLDIAASVIIDAEGQGIIIDASGNDPTPDSTVNDQNYGDDGDGSRVFDVDLGWPFDARHVILVGLTITGGDVFDDGGGIRVYSEGAPEEGEEQLFDSFVLIDSWIVNNSAGINSAGGPVSVGSGGGIHLFAAANVFAEDSFFTIRNTQILQNAAIEGGGISASLLGTQLDIVRSEVDSNTAVNRGGGIYSVSGSSIVAIEETSITNNQAGLELLGTGTGSNSGGGVFIDFRHELGTPEPYRIYRSEISGNQTGKNGGGIAAALSTLYNEDTTTQLALYNSTISNNQAGAGVGSTTGEGGGVHIEISQESQSYQRTLETHIELMTITENTAFVGGGVYSSVESTLNKKIKTFLTNSIISGNKLHDNTTADNFYGSIDLNSTRHNLFGHDGTIAANTFFDYDTHLLIPYTDINTLGNNNIDNGGINDPELGPLQHNRGRTRNHLPQPGSPVIDAGSDIFPPSVPFAPLPRIVTDQRGNGFPRILDGDNTGGPRVDMGSIEFDATATPGQPPTIHDIRLDRRGTIDDWHDAAEVSFAERVADGDQFRPIATTGANAIDVVFSQDVNMPADGSALSKLEFTEHVSQHALNTTLDFNDFDYNYDSIEFVATWTLKSNVLVDDVLPNGKYAIHLDSTSILDSTNTFSLDAKWDNDDNEDTATNTPDDVSDDDNMQRNFVVGDGVIDSDETSFRFHFALLAGDYQGDQDVDGGDFFWWQLGLAGTDGDGDGNFNSDNDDLEIWEDNFGERLALRALHGGDFNDDEVVDVNDWIIFIANIHGPETAPEFGNINGDGAINHADFVLFKDRYLAESVSAWYEAPAGGVAAIVLDAAPVITNVIISGTNSNDDPYQFSSLLGAGEQLRSVPVAGADTVSVQFSEQISVFSISQSSLHATNLDGASPGSATAYSYDALTQTATWTFGSALADGRHLFTLDDAMMDLGEEDVDGEVANPWELADASTALLESGDGQAGGQFRFRATILANDADRDNIDGATDYTEWLSVEPGMILVSTETDEVDSDYSIGDMSLREAVQAANAASEPTTIVVPAGFYALNRIGTEAGNASFNDLDITGDVAIVGAGAGVTLIDNSALVDSHGRAFDVATASSRLDLSQVTLRSGGVDGSANGRAIQVKAGGELILTDSAVVNLYTSYNRAIDVYSADATIRRSVFTNLDGFYNNGLAISAGGSSASLTIGDSIFALNYIYDGVTTANVFVSASVTKTNEGNNLYDDASGGFFNTTPGTGDYLGTPDYVVTSVADTFDHTDNADALSLREAVDLANQTSGVEEVWLPAWDFVLTRYRDYSTQSTDTDVSYGDIDISDSIIIRGVTGFTSIDWHEDAPIPHNERDKVFDLLGSTADGKSDATAGGASFLEWQQQLGSPHAFEEYTADFNDDGYVDGLDQDSVWQSYFGNTLDLEGLTVMS